MTLTHAPYQPTPDSPDWNPKRTDDNGEAKYFKDDVAFLDKNVGRIISKLEKLNLTENTLIIFLGDNGTGKNTVSQFKGKPYTGGKGSSTAAGMRVPLLVSWKGKIKAEQVNTNLVDSTDFLPTIAEAAGLTLPEDKDRDGISFYPQLIGKEYQPREWIYSWHLGVKPAGEETVIAFDKEYKLYRSGNFVEFINEVKDEKQLAQNSLDEKQKAELQKLENVLDKYKDARPEWAKKSEKPAGSPDNKEQKKGKRQNQRRNS
jgi:arylsulfatase A